MWTGMREILGVNQCLVNLSVAWLGKCFLTIITLVWLLSCMHTLMFVQGIVVVKHLRTIAALVITLTSMFHLVLTQRTGLGKTLATELANMLLRFYSCVSQLMLFTAISIKKAFVTQSAFELPLPIMGDHVILQVIATFIRLATNLTRVYPFSWLLLHLSFTFILTYAIIQVSETAIL